MRQAIEQAIICREKIMRRPMWKITKGLIFALIGIALSAPVSGQAIYSGSDSAIVGFPSNGKTTPYAQPPLAAPPPQIVEPIPNFGSGAFDANAATYGQRCRQAPVRPDIRASGTRYCY
jgi:hypothetical protein